MEGIFLRHGLHREVSVYRVAANPDRLTVAFAVLCAACIVRMTIQPELYFWWRRWANECGGLRSHPNVILNRSMFCFPKTPTRIFIMITTTRKHRIPRVFHRPKMIVPNKVIRPRATGEIHPRQRPRQHRNITPSNNSELRRHTLKSEGLDKRCQTFA